MKGVVRDLSFRTRLMRAGRDRKSLPHVHSHSLHALVLLFARQSPERVSRGDIPAIAYLFDGGRNITSVAHLQRSKVMPV